LLRFIALFQRSTRDRDFARELESHLALHTDENLRNGISQRDARREALLKLGGVESAKESHRDRRGLPVLETFLQDLRYATRTLRKNPGFSAIAILTLALGIGANSAIFSLVNGILLRPLPFPQPDRLVSITDSYPAGTFAAIRETSKSIDVAAYREAVELNLTGLGESVRLYGTQVSANFFSLLGARTAQGRTFIEGEDLPGRDRELILSHALWQQKFGGDLNVIGRSVLLEAVNRQIVGVMPADFHFGSPKTQFWVPLNLDPRQVGDFWGSGFMALIARLRAGSTLAQAQTEFLGMLPQLRKLFPWRMPDALWSGADVEPLRENIVGNVQEKLLLLLGAIALVLLVACVNVANLLLARGASRRREMAVRSALGAARSRICRQLLTESVLLGACGGALGLLLALAGLSWLKGILPADTPRLADASIDWRVLAFTAALAIFAGAFFGLAPALHASKIDLTDSLKSRGNYAAASNSMRLRDILAIAEIALAMVLVIGAGLLARSLWEMSRVNPGFRTESVVTARITPNESFCASVARCRDFYSALLARLAALPGVERAATVGNLPLNGRWSGFAADLEGHPRDPKDPAPILFESVITQDYLQLLGIPLLRGRSFAAADMAPGAAPIALVTAATARKYWPNEDPVGKHVKPVFDKDWTTVVGVVGDVHETSLVSKWPAFVDGEIYEPFGNGRGKIRREDQTLVVKITGSGNFAQMLRATVADLNPDVPVGEIKPLRTVVSESMAAPRSMMALFAGFAALALVLGAIGVYGVISYSIAQRTPEISIRKALGARTRDVMRLVLAQGMKFAFWGIAIGLLASFALTRLIVSLLFGVSAVDPKTYLAVSLLMAAVALLACYVPARRAMSVDPIRALRHE
jgi:predicted permease